MIRAAVRRVLDRILGISSTSETASCLDPGCEGAPILVYWQVVGNPVTGRPVRQETYHCPECGLIFLRAHATDQTRGSWKLDVKERLKQLGYL